MDYLNDILEQIGNLKGLALVAAACFGLGYVIRLIPVIPNKWIPPVVMLAGPIIAPLIIAPGAASPDLRNPVVGIVAQGLLVSVVVHYLHEKVISHLEDWIKGKLPGNTETKPPAQ